MISRKRKPVLKQYNFGIVCFGGTVISGQRLSSNASDVLSEVEYLAAKAGFVTAGVECTVAPPDIALSPGDGDRPVRISASRGRFEVWTAQPSNPMDSRGRVTWTQRISDD